MIPARVAGHFRFVHRVRLRRAALISPTRSRTHAQQYSYQLHNNCMRSVLGAKEIVCVLKVTRCLQQRADLNSRCVLLLNPTVFTGNQNKGLPPFHFVPFRPENSFSFPRRDDCATRARPHNSPLRCECCLSDGVTSAALRENL